ncbi:MAG: D-alanyl-D-alanine carboxypeptidase family protein [Cellulomonadaceae bacterium]|jgi:hypothetical protein|nr:D-alanyl-D-alanine carboxypeptidase family protein [Cellulomonadaceae bacterium]
MKHHRRVFIASLLALAMLGFAAPSGAAPSESVLNDASQKDPAVESATGTVGTASSEASTHASSNFAAGLAFAAAQLGKISESAGPQGLDAMSSLLSTGAPSDVSLFKAGLALAAAHLPGDSHGALAARLTGSPGNVASDGSVSIGRIVAKPETLAESLQAVFLSMEQADVSAVADGRELSSELYEAAAEFSALLAQYLATRPEVAAIITPYDLRPPQADPCALLHSAARDNLSEGDQETSGGDSAGDVDSGEEHGVTADVVGESGPDQAGSDEAGSSQAGSGQDSPDADSDGQGATRERVSDDDQDLARYPHEVLEAAIAEAGFAELPDSATCTLDTADDLGSDPLDSHLLGSASADDDGGILASTGEVPHARVVGTGSRLNTMIDDVDLRPTPVSDEDVIVAAMNVMMLLEPAFADFATMQVLLESGTDDVPEAETTSGPLTLEEAVARWGNSTDGYLNGALPPDVLCLLPFAPGHKLRCDAAYQLTRLNVEFSKEFGNDLALTDSYRTIVSQVRLHFTKPGLAATPGHSMHGWGMAVDLSSPMNRYSSAEHQWLRLNGPDFGWDNPTWARADGGKPEPWHFEFFGADQMPNRALSAEDIAMYARQLGLIGEEEDEDEAQDEDLDQEDAKENEKDAAKKAQKAKKDGKKENNPGPSPSPLPSQGSHPAGTPEPGSGRTPQGSPNPSPSPTPSPGNSGHSGHEPTPNPSATPSPHPSPSGTPSPEPSDPGSVTQPSTPPSSPPSPSPSPLPAHLGEQSASETPQVSLNTASVGESAADRSLAVKPESDGQD